MKEKKKTNKKIYKEFCESNAKIPLFSQYFWMNAVCGEENWDVIIINDSGRIDGTLCYFLEGVDNKIVRKAPLTQTNGILYFYPENIKKYSNKVSFEYKIAKKIIKEIEKLEIDSFRQYFHYSFTNWLPFRWNGYSQTTRYTYVIEDTSNLDIIEEQFEGKIRTGIRKAEKIVTISESLNYKEFYFTNIKTFKRQNLEIPYSFEFFKKLYFLLKERNIVKIYEAKDDKNNIHSCALFVWDNDTVYYLMSGSDPEYRNSQALTLLIFKGIELANKLHKKFDFEGSMMKNVEKFIRGFGAQPIPYFDISKKFKGDERKSV